MVLTPGDDVGEQLWALAYKYVERGAVGGLLLVMMTKIQKHLGNLGDSVHSWWWHWGMFSGSRAHFEIL